ncbi:MAG: 23S rRNA (pseudouridine(1915)-N(3))-methyltransferase RlmH [Raoultibacter sp.]|jgi:23S rRNA (pseudouridine1915-N3)-methyltransferase
MNITIIAVGKLKERYWTEACNEYLKRCRPYAKLAVRELADIDPGSVGGIDEVLSREGEAIISAIPERAHVVALAIEGKQKSSEEFSAWFDEQAVSGTSDIVFIIGGSYGLSREVLKRAHSHLSFGRNTLPHNLMRVILLEQIYRAFKISRGEPYHK